MFDSPYRVEPGKKVDLRKWPTDDTGQFEDKADARPIIKKNLEKLIELQELLYASNTHALLIVLQAMDAGGKDGAIDHVFSGVNPQGCSVTSFKIPTQLELAHDYLWRYHMAVPKRGQIGIFNRSHYESVLVERVHDIVNKDIWSKRYQQINDWEQTLIAEKTVVIKFFLHISKEEQKKRLESRLEDKTKNWKLDPNDLAERKRWDDYMAAFEDALRFCSTEKAPWYIVPADHKWFRNWVISDAIVRTLSSLDMKYPPAPEGLDKIKIK
ncbi:MAG: polyphosphate kinase 2 family protein [Planctomycetota bacterium]|nr:polyphosphate kinase 2 family protein [Planctomycetota bacterium]